MIYWTSFVPDLGISENSAVGKDIFPQFLAYINLCTEEVNVRLCEAVDCNDLLLGVPLTAPAAFAPHRGLHVYFLINLILRARDCIGNTEHANEM